MAPGQARAGRDPVPRTPEGRRSMPIRYLPDRALSRDVPQSPTNRVKCLIYNTGVARRDRGLAAYRGGGNKWKGDGGCQRPTGRREGKICRG